MRRFKNSFFLLVINIHAVIVYGQSYSTIDSVSFEHFHQTDSNLVELSFGAARSLSRGLYFNEKLTLISQNPFFMDGALDLPSFDLLQPVVDVTYFLGPNQEQLFSVFHSQNIKQGVNYAIHFFKNNYDGYYENQATNHNFFQANFSFKPNSSIYAVKLNYNHHRFFHEQNGGIQNDSNFTDDIFFSRNRLLMDVNLPDAYSKDVLHKVNLEQSVTLSEKRDSLNVLKQHDLISDLSYVGQSRTYFDSISNNYDWLYFLDTNVTYDTLSKNNLHGNLAYSYRRENDSLNSTDFKIGFSYNMINHMNKNIDTSFYNASLFTSYGLKINKGEFGVNGVYFLSGYREGDYEFESAFKYTYKNFNFRINGKYQRVTPAYELLKYFGNHSNWSNIFSDQQILKLGANIAFKNWRLNSNYTDLYSPVFFNYQGLPEQYDGATQVIQSQLSKNFALKNWNISPSVCYQYQGGLTIFRLPEWVGILDFSYNIDAFKSALKLNIGMQAKMFSEFYLMNFAPDLGVFFISNERLQNAYAIADFYLNAKIQRVKFSFSITHANAGLMGFNYFSALHYPFPDRYFKMGLSWMFLN
mgnify:CR=1 FL=1